MGCRFLEDSFRKKNGTNWPPSKDSEIRGKQEDSMERWTAEGKKEETNQRSCSIWNSRAQRRVCTVRCRLAKDSWATPEIKGSHSFFRGNANEKLEQGDTAYQSKSCES